ncbi:mechanosensitive ion channel family protein [Sulfuritortus calidifontis]|nr:mechanosensitive ion channel domain-containing protein [Sulfuritortus calidifontis]
MTERQTENLLEPLLADLTDFALIGQLILLIAAFALGRLALHAIRRQLSPTWRAKWGEHAGNRVALPALMLLLVLIGRSVLAHWQSVHLLNLAVPLLLSLLIVQASFALLRRIFQPSPALRIFEHTVSWLVWGVLALHITGYLDGLIAALDAVGFTVGKQRLSLYSVLLALISIVITLMVALWAARLIEQRFIEASPLNVNMKLALTKLTRSLLLVLAVLIALPLVGIDITVLSVFGGALGVGIGLGLQKIASNYVSGFTLLLDQSIRIGDMVTVGDRFGQVQRIATRYTVIRALDGTEAIIPNEALITTTVINHTLANPNNRVTMPVQVAYGTDLERAREALLGAVAGRSRVLPEPSPAVLLKGFGESGIDLELAFWIADPEEGQMALRSEINWAIWQAFQREGIEIPYPHRVVEIVNK